MEEELVLTMMARIRAFEKRHGGREASSVYTNWIWYANGANRDFLPEGLLKEPPANDFERLQAIVYFHKGRLVQAVNAFDALKQKLSHSASSDRGGLDQMKKLGAVVAQRNSEVQAAQAELAKTPTAIARAGAKQFQAEENARMQEWQDALKLIRV